MPAGETSSARPAPADVLVIFGITGDLARVMTFRSLYRLEARGLLDCPIVGVAFDDWTLDRLISHRLPLDGVTEAFDLMHTGTGLRVVLDLNGGSDR